MNSKAVLGPERIVATLSRQLCNGPLHNLKLEANRGVYWQ